MIETTALLFSVCSIKYFIDQAQSKGKLPILFFCLFMSLAFLQKSTTAAPVFISLCLDHCYIGIEKFYPQGPKALLYHLLRGAAILTIPFVIAVTWITYSHIIRFENSLGQQVSLQPWFWGTIKQRLSHEMYYTVLWKRIFLQNLAGILGVIVLVAPFKLIKIPKAIHLLIAGAILLALLPILMFANVHIIHTYYQTANLIFLIYAAAISLGCSIHYYPERAYFL